MTIALVLGSVALPLFGAQARAEPVLRREPTLALGHLGRDRDHGWEAEIRAGAERINEPGAWAMSALQTPDPARAAVFYEGVFGWLAEPWGPVHLLRLPGYAGGTDEQPVPRDVVAVMAPAQPGGGSAWAVDFWVADLDAAVARAADLGGRVLVPIHDRPPARSAVLADPEGAAFSLSQLAA